MTKRCGVVAIAGAPNAGKSTLLNRLVGGKVSIVTPKAQTTRSNVRGICVHGETQLIFIDTPGIFDAPKAFEKAMVQAAWSGIGDADAVLMLIDAAEGITEDTVRIIDRLKLTGKPAAVALNKVDAVKKHDLLTLASAFAYGFERIFMISALHGDGVDDVKAWLAAAMPEGPFLYPEDEMSDVPLRMLASEITREKIFLRLHQELPYSTFVETEHWEEEGKMLRISQVIYVEREGQKKIVIGKDGDMLKAIGTASRKDLEEITGKKLHLSLFVKVKSWRDNPQHYRDLGLIYKP